MYPKVAFLAVAASLGGVRGTPAPQAWPMRPAPSPADILGGASTTAASPRIVMVDEDGTRRETGGTEGCFGTDGKTQLAALPPGVMAITYPEYGCKGQPIAVICGQGVAENLSAPAPAPTGHTEADGGKDPGAGTTTGGTPAGGSATASETELGEEQTGTRFDVERVAMFRTTPSAGTMACTVPGASMAYGKTTRERMLRTDAQMMALERYAGMPSIRMPEALPVKSVFLSRVGPGGVTTCPLVAPRPAAPAAAPSPVIPAATIMTTTCPETPTRTAAPATEPGPVVPAGTTPGAAQVTASPAPAAREAPEVAATIMTTRYPATASPTPAAVGVAPTPMAPTAERVETSPIPARIAKGYAVQLTPIVLSDSEP